MANHTREIGRQVLSPNEQPPNDIIQVARLFLDLSIFDEAVMDRIVNPPASKAVVKNLPDVIVTEEDDKCPVCLKEYETAESVKKMPCNHKFHAECINRWLDKTNTCPMCRFELPTDDEEYEAYRKGKNTPQTARRGV